MAASDLHGHRPGGAIRLDARLPRHDQRLESATDRLWQLALKLIGRPSDDGRGPRSRCARARGLFTGAGRMKAKMTSVTGGLGRADGVGRRRIVVASQDRPTEDDPPFREGRPRRNGLEGVYR